MSYLEKNRTHETITIVYIESTKNYKAQFTFNWSSKHWKNHYDEIATIPNLTHSHIEDWKPILNILNGVDPPSLLLITDLKQDHQKFIAKLILCYGTEEIRFIKI